MPIGPVVEWNAMSEQPDNILRPDSRHDKKEQTLSKPIAVVCHWRCCHDVCNTKMKYTKWNWSGIIHGISLCPRVWASANATGTGSASAPSSVCVWTAAGAGAGVGVVGGAQYKALLHICWTDTIVSLCRSLVGWFLMRFGSPLPVPMPGTETGRKDQSSARWRRWCYFCSCCSLFLPMGWWCHQQKKGQLFPLTLKQLMDWLAGWLDGSSATGVAVCLAMSPLALYIDVRCLALTAHKV